MSTTPFATWKLENVRAPQDIRVEDVTGVSTAWLSVQGLSAGWALATVQMLETTLNSNSGNRCFVAANPWAAGREPVALEILRRNKRLEGTDLSNSRSSCRPRHGCGAGRQGSLGLAAAASQPDRKAGSHGAARDRQYGDPFRGNSRPGCRRSGVRLVNCCGCVEPPQGCRDMDLVLPHGLGGLHAACRGLSIGVGHDRQLLRAVSERATGSVARQQEKHHSASHRLVVLILHAHDRLAHYPLAQVVDGPFSLDNHDVELGDGFGLLRTRCLGRYRQKRAKQQADCSPNC